VFVLTAVQGKRVIWVWLQCLLDHEQTLREVWQDSMVKVIGLENYMEKLDDVYEKAKRWPVVFNTIKVL